MRRSAARAVGNTLGKGLWAVALCGGWGCSGAATAPGSDTDAGWRLLPDAGSVRVDGAAGPNDAGGVDAAFSRDAGAGTGQSDAGPSEDVPDSGAHDASLPFVDCALPEIRCVDDTPGPMQEYATIQACAEAAVPGDRCAVFPGRYDERVRPPRSGAAGASIAFVAQPGAIVRGFDLSRRDYLQIVGFEVTSLGFSRDGTAAIFLEGSSHHEILGNHIHDTDGGTCIRERDVDLVPSNDVHIADNVISRCATAMTGSAGIGITVFGDGNLVERNDVSHLGDDFVRMTGGERNVIRDNVFHDNSLADFPGSSAHIDGIQNWCTSPGLRTRHLLIEHNVIRDVPSPDTHFVIYQDYGRCGNADFLVRHNVIVGTGDYPQINDVATARVRFYRNTLVSTSVAASPRPWESVGFANGSSGGSLVANIFYDAVRDGSGVYYVDDTSREGFSAHHNLAFNPSCGSACTFRDPIRSEAGAVLGMDPRFTSADDASLRADSPAIDHGGYLTRVAATDTGSGTALRLEDAGYFQDGWAGVAADWVAIGAGGHSVGIVAIDYATQTVTLTDSVVRAAGDPVWLARSSNGTVVSRGAGPDIGALEHD